MDVSIRLLRANEIDCRIAQIKKNGLQLLLYKDARTDMSILDETFGPMNWQRKHSRDNANCTISIWDDEKRCWVDKEDTGTESNTEAQKGLASDSFKRAGVNWGIGRELYTSPFIWVTPPNCEIKDDGGRYKCFDRFEVSEIGYNEHREINRLVVINSKTHNVAFEYGVGRVNKAQKPEPKETHARQTKPAEKPVSDAHATAEQIAYIKEHASDEDYMEIMTEFGPELENLSQKDAVQVIKEIDLHNADSTVRCERCQKVITGVALPNGTTMTGSEIIAQSKLTYKGIYCYDCAKALKAQKNKRKAG